MPFRFLWMMIKLIYLLLSLGMLSCVGREMVSIVELSPASSFHLEKMVNQNPYPGRVETYSRNDSDFIMVYDELNNNLIEYYRPSGEISRVIPTGFYSRDAVFQFDNVGKDSIFLLYNPSQRIGYTHDSILMLINDAGGVMKYYALDQAPVWTINNPRYSRDSVSYVHLGTSPVPIYSNHKLFIDLTAYGYGFGDTVFHSGRYPVGAHINLKSGKLQNHYIDYPGGPGIYYPKITTSVFRAIGPKGNPIYSFAHSSQLYEYDVNTGKVVKHRAGSYLFDTIYPLENIDPAKPLYTRPNLDLTQFRYGKLLYNSKLNVYFRLYVFPGEIEGKHIKNRDWGFIMLDTNFNKLGEGLFPKGFWMTRIYDARFMVFWDKPGSDTNFRFQNYEFKIKKGTRQDLLNIATSSPNSYVKEGGVGTYIKDLYNPKEADANILFLPLGYSCISCIQTSLNYFAAHHDEEFEVPLYLVIASDKPAAIDKALKDVGLDEGTKGLMIDSTGQFWNYNSMDNIKSYLLQKRDGEIPRMIMLIPEKVRRLDDLIRDD